MNENIINSVDEDIEYGNKMFKEYSHDREKMEKLFNYLLFKYIDKIQNIADGLAVISSYGDNLERTSIYKQNIHMIIKRLEMFRSNGYSNEGLLDFYIQSEENFDILDSKTKISDIIIEIGLMDNITIREKEEIAKKLGEIEYILALTETKARRWELLRPYVLWLSGKDYNVAVKILPLFLRLR